MRPNFKEKFTEIRTCGSREQCMGPTQKKPDTENFHFSAIQTQAQCTDKINFSGWMVDDPQPERDSYELKCAAQGLLMLCFLCLKLDMQYNFSIRKI